MMGKIELNGQLEKLNNIRPEISFLSMPFKGRQSCFVI